MSGSIKWDNVPPAEIRAEAESLLEMNGESKRIRQYLQQTPELQKFREDIQKACMQIIEKQGISNLTADSLYDIIFPTVQDNFPQSVMDELNSKITAFLQGQFEDHA